MATISVPLKKEQEQKLDELVRSGVGESRAAVMRKALEKLAEDKAVEEILRAEQEPTLKGDLEMLARKFRRA